MKYSPLEYQEWTCLNPNVPIDKVEETIKKYPDLCTKLLTKELVLPTTIQHYNRKLLSTHKTRPNPRYLGYIEYKFPKGYSGLIYKERFKRCGHPAYLEFKDCTFNFEIRYSSNNDPCCVSFWVKGKHRSYFKPTKKYFSITKKQKSEIMKLTEVKVKPKLIQKMIWRKTETSVSKKTIRNVIEYEKSKTRRNSDSCIAAQIAIQEYIEKNKLILTSSKEDFLESSPTNYLWIFGDKNMLNKA